MVTFWPARFWPSSASPKKDAVTRPVVYPNTQVEPLLLDVPVLADVGTLSCTFGLIQTPEPFFRTSCSTELTPRATSGLTASWQSGAWAGSFAPDASVTSTRAMGAQ